MKIEVPMFNEDGSVKATAVLDANEAQHLLQFALNFLVSMGLTVQTFVSQQTEEEQVEIDPSKLN